MNLSTIKYGLALFLLVIVTGCGSNSGTSSVSVEVMGLVPDDFAAPTKLYLADFNANSVGSVAIAGGTRSTMTSTSAGFNGPEGVVLFGASLFVVDALNHVIRQVSTSAPYTTTTYAGTVGVSGNSDADGTFKLPRNAVADVAGNLYVTDSGNNTIRKIAAGTKTVTTIASGFNNPWGIAIDNATPQNLYVTDIGTHSIKKLTNSGGAWSMTVLAGNVAGNSGLPTNANGTAAYFNSPLGITTDNTYLYVADYGNNAVRRVELAAPNAVLLIAGSSAGTAGSLTNTTGTSALLSSPFAITYAAGALYVADQGAALIRKVTTTSPFAVSEFTLN